jgi:hypothetical protein
MHAHRADGLGRRTYIFERNGGSNCDPQGICIINGKTFGVTMTTPEYVIPNIQCNGGCVLQWVSSPFCMHLGNAYMHPSIFARQLAGWQ